MRQTTLISASATSSKALGQVETFRGSLFEDLDALTNANISVTFAPCGRAARQAIQVGQ
jgi:hypothetical protein